MNIYEEEIRIKTICEFYKIKNFEIDKSRLREKKIDDLLEGDEKVELSVNVVGDVNLDSLKLTVLPFKFGRISGTFNCSFNKLLNTTNFPEYVGDEFYCYSSNIEDFKTMPKTVVGNINLGGNRIKSLKGWITKCDGVVLNLSSNKLINLKFYPES